MTSGTALSSLGTLVAWGLDHVQNYHPVNWGAVNEALPGEAQGFRFGKKQKMWNVHRQDVGCEERRGFGKRAAGVTPTGRLGGNVAYLTLNAKVQSAPWIL